MPSSKGRGHGKDSPQKKAAARRLHTTRSSTKSNKQRGIEEDQYDTLAALPSRKSKPSLKKLTLPSESTTSPKKQDPSPVNLPGSKSGIVVPQAVTLQKRDQASGEESSNDGNSTRDAKLSNSSKDISSNNSSNNDNSKASTFTRTKNASVTMASNLTPGADPRLDKQLDNVLKEFLLAKGGGHEIRQMFKEEEIYQFMNFVDYTVEDLEDLRRKSHNSMKGFNKQKVTQIYNVIRYYNFSRFRCHSSRRPGKLVNAGLQEMDS